MAVSSLDCARVGDAGAATTTGYSIIASTSRNCAKVVNTYEYVFAAK